MPNSTIPITHLLEILFICVCHYLGNNMKLVIVCR